MFHKHEVKYFHERVKEIEEHRRVINFYLEVSRNVPKFILQVDFFDNMEKNVHMTNSARFNRMTNAFANVKTKHEGTEKESIGTPKAVDAVKIGSSGNVLVLFEKARYESPRDVKTILGVGD